LSNSSETPTPPPVTTSRRLLINTVLNVANAVIVMVINLVLIGFFLDAIGEEGYGVWILIGSIFSYRSLLTMGLNSAVNRHIPVFVVRGDRDGIRRVISTGFAYHLLLGILVAIVSFVLYWNIEAWFVIDPVYVERAEFLALIVGFSFSISITLQPYEAVLSGYQRFDIISVSSVSAILIRTLLVVIFLNQGFGLLAMAWIYGMAEIVIRLIPVVYTQRLTNGITPSLRSIDRRLLWEMLTYGSSSMIYNSTPALVYKSADLVIAGLIATALVPRFFIAVAPILVLTTLVRIFSRTVKPAVSDLEARHDLDRLLELAFLSQKYNLILIFPSLAFFLVMGHSLMDVWVGGKFPEPNAVDELASLLGILSLGAAIRLTQYSNFMVLLGRGFHGAYGLTAFVTILISVVAAFVLVKFLAGGLEAVAWSCSLPMALTSGIVLPIYFNCKMGIPFIQTLRKSWIPAIICSAPGIFVMIAWNAFAPPADWLSLIAVIFVVGSLSAATGWFFVFTDIERRRVRQLLPF